MYRAKIGFSGLISMSKGEVREIKDKDLIKDLLNANYIELVVEEKPKKENKPKK
jgi:hypothetical protein